MNKFNKYNLRLLAIFPIIIMTVYISAYNEVKNNFYKRGLLNSENKVLFLGDSVIKSSGKCDTGNNGIDDILAKQSSQTVLGMSSNAYSPIIYGDILSLLQKSTLRPKVVIVPINLRSFSESWHTNPHYQYFKQRSAIQLMNHPESIKLYLEYSSNILQHNKKGLYDEWMNEKVNYPGFNITKRKDLHAILSKAFKDAPSFECPGHAPDDYQKNALRLQFMYHYMFVLSNNNPMFTFTEKMIHVAKSLDIKLLFYITPINIEQGERLIGKLFRKRYEKNIMTLTGWLKDKNVSFIDLSADLPDSNFIDQFCACEHVNNKGKQYIAGKIAALLAKTSK